MTKPKGTASDTSRRGADEGQTVSTPRKILESDPGGPLSLGVPLPSSGQTHFPPEGLQDRGEAVWKAVTDAFELQAHEGELLVEIARTVDLLDALQALVTAQGETLPWGEGIRANPALVELRQHRVVLARMVGALGIPADEDLWGTGPRYRKGRAS